ncbi:hypothetical protein Q4E93_28475 [Flavitalea sp. BT771]|uniref:hypothetical protein n=1 Tax=Flavitalea sp. BT771 TaxID=3063329 RepID=UPI0026E1269E|nr:hypothetical protein [Flavitalea sp. BT771]MDO6434580.1 hypothetical protein [Flavitalea sp. BT771]MDV6223480.1 hypothetical protein [Flavitalea sp. BT771]
MKSKSLANWPALLPENALTAYNPSKSQRQKPGVVKLMPMVPPPDEKTIRELNELAARRPFCTFRKVRRHDML